MRITKKWYRDEIGDTDDYRMKITMIAQTKKEAAALQTLNLLLPENLSEDSKEDVYVFMFRSNVATLNHSETPRDKKGRMATLILLTRYFDESFRSIL